jgi:hypothetical protein
MDSERISVTIEKEVYVSASLPANQRLLIRKKESETSIEVLVVRKNESIPRRPLAERDENGRPSPPPPYRSDGSVLPI